MGGYGSGRSGGRATVESALTLDLYALFRQGYIRPGECTVGTIVWHALPFGERTAEVWYGARLESDRGSLFLGSSSGSRVSEIKLMTTPQHLGGHRWWFRCPLTGSLVAKVHLPRGARIFGSQRAYGLGYRSQRESLRDRALSRAFKLRDRLGAGGGIGAPIEKPVGMRWETFDRKMDRVREAEQTCLAGMAALAVGLEKRLRARI